MQLTKSVSWSFREVFPTSFFYGDSVEASNFVQLENHECLFQSLNFTLQVKLVLILTAFLPDSTFWFSISFILSVVWALAHVSESQYAVQCILDWMPYLQHAGIVYISLSEYIITRIANRTSHLHRNETATICFSFTFHHMLSKEL